MMSHRLSVIKIAHSKISLLLLFLLGLLAATSEAAPDTALSGIAHWKIELTDTDVPADPQIQMVILDPDHHADFSTWAPSCLHVAYLSVGEAEDHRPYWVRISSASYLLAQDKETEGNVRVDFRDPEWQRILLKEEIPRALAGGFQGLMLDQLDSIAYVKESDPKKYAGTLDALEKWLSELRKSYPDLILLASGREALEITAPYVNGYVTEGVFTTWDPASRRVRRTTREERDERLDLLGNAMVVARHPVFTIEEMDPQQKSLRRWTIEESLKRGFHPFLKIK